MTFWLDDEKYLAEVRKRLEANLVKAVLFVVSKIREKISAGQPYRRYVGRKGVYYRGLEPSQPGEPPKVLTGQLRRSVTFRLALNVLKAEVGSSLEYAKALELGTSKMKARPFIRRTIKEHQEEILAILQEGF